MKLNNVTQDTQLLSVRTKIPTQVSLTSTSIDLGSNLCKVPHKFRVQLTSDPRLHHLLSILKGLVLGEQLLN